MASPLNKLRELSAQIRQLECALELLDWDSQTGAPAGGVEGRAAQIALLSEIIHQKLSSSSLGRLLDAAEREPAAKEFFNARLIRFLRREYEINTKVPARFVSRFARLTVTAQRVWEEARSNNDFKRFSPYLHDIFQMNAEYSGFFAGEHIYEPLLRRFEPGFSAGEVERVIGELRPAQVALVKRAVTEEKARGATLLRHKFSIGAQKRLTQWAAGILGFDFNCGVISESMHPFTCTVGVHDVRITTNYRESDLSSLFSTFHETGHALYEQNVAESLIGGVLGSQVSLSLHESQSRLWENMVGRSPDFLHCVYKQIKRFFPRVATTMEEDDFVAVVNEVAPSLIRVDADEATYNLHIIIRFELELALLRGELSVADLPEAWRAKVVEYLGIAPGSDTDGVLQDVHWACGLIGYFPTYLLGNLISAQIWRAANRAIPDLPYQLRRGQTSALRQYLTEKLYVFGGAYDAEEALEHICGEKLSPEPYLEYLRNKFL